MGTHPSLPVFCATDPQPRRQCPSPDSFSLHPTHGHSGRRSANRASRTGAMHLAASKESCVITQWGFGDCRTNLSMAPLDAVDMVLPTTTLDRLIAAVLRIFGLAHLHPHPHPPVMLGEPKCQLSFTTLARSSRSESWGPYTIHVNGDWHITVAQGTVAPVMA